MLQRPGALTEKQSRRPNKQLVDKTFYRPIVHAFVPNHIKDTQDDLRQVGYLPEERGLYRRMRVGEQALYFARLKGMERSHAEQELRQWFDRLGMTAWWDKPAGRLSKGMQQRLQLVVTVVHKPSLLILDEPFSGFDADNSAMLNRELQRLKQDGAAILLSTHNLQAATELCDKTIQL